jgi:gas vesicle protein
MRQDSAINLLWFVAGITIGTAAGMVAAPKPGTDTRRLLTSKAGEVGHLLATTGRELYEKGRELADEAAEMYDDGRHLIEDGEPTEA